MRMHAVTDTIRKFEYECEYDWATVYLDDAGALAIISSLGTWGFDFKDNDNFIVWVSTVDVDELAKMLYRGSPMEINVAATVNEVHNACLELGHIVPRVVERRLEAALWNEDTFYDNDINNFIGDVNDYLVFKDEPDFDLLTAVLEELQTVLKDQEIRKIQIVN